MTTTLTWYTLFLAASGQYLTHTPTPSEPTADVGVITTPGEPDLTAVEWDAVQRMWVPLAAPSRSTLSRKEFLDQFTSTELAAAMALRRSTDLAVFGAIESFVLYVQVSGAIELTDPTTVAGVQFLVTLGILTPARAAAILSPVAG